ncbi:putative glycine dehydrogenase (decarboxylating) subunit 1 [Frankliniella fusca]|uniref:Glycine dehydrogenase (Decarboxylating) subunit 1 n=1 Tax=Frankliniella fusca TaxID=407009 RepID=A0AAE1H6C7_9NEOP|nr:putative glycine dehydrogenase (decarboxylating) subunit 1 [Frankliniella fusca]
MDSPIISKVVGVINVGVEIIGIEQSDRTDAETIRVLGGSVNWYLLIFKSGNKFTRQQSLANTRRENSDSDLCSVQQACNLDTVMRTCRF